MPEDTFELKECFDEVAVLAPLGLMVILVLVSMLVAHHYWRKSRSDYDSISNHSETRRELEQCRKEKDDAILRLSELLSTRIRDGNPNIVDLNDENRPTKLKDKLSELYDNEYTDVACVLETECQHIFSEDDLQREMSKLLLDILKNAFEYCTLAAQNQLLMVQQIILFPNADKNYGSRDSPTISETLPRDFMKRVKDQRKVITPDLSGIRKQVEFDIRKRYNETPFANCLENERLKVYTAQCVEIVWLMSVQDPPMQLVFDDNRLELLRPFTRSGSVVEFHVWPTVFLTEGGNMMSKGVAQFTNKTYL